MLGQKNTFLFAQSRKFPYYTMQQTKWTSILQVVWFYKYNTSNNQRLQSAGDNDQSQNAFAPLLCFA